jgi:hypothetical protein
MFKLYFAILLFLAVLPGCQSFLGPNALSNSHPAFNQAIVSSLNQQMLLNLVRLRYRDEPHFLTVTSVNSSLSFSGSVGMHTSLDLGVGGNIIEPNLGVAYSETPTISYQPLQGEAFLKSVLSPISLEAILMLTESGWNAERVFGLCVERINNLYNAPTASGPTPDTEPVFKDFKKMIKLFREMQLNQSVEIGVDKNNSVQMLFKADNTNQININELINLLGIKTTQKRSLVNIGINFLYPPANEITLRTRSISSMLFYLSQLIAVPEPHIAQGLVTMTKNAQGERFDWSQTPIGERFKVSVSETYPEAAFLAVPYRGYWYYIADNDLQSKSTFMLLRQLFDLQAGQSKIVGPTLTLPVR